jgi:hypothetical protein
MYIFKFFIGLIVIIALSACYEYHIKTEDHVVLNNITVSPNPTTDVLIVKVKEMVDDPVNYRIINSYGQPRSTGELSFSDENEQFIEVGHFSTGYYTLELTFNEVEVSFKFLKQK